MSDIIKSVGPMSKAYAPLWDCLGIGLRHLILVSGRGCGKTYEICGYKDFAMNRFRTNVISARGQWNNLASTSWDTFKIVTDNHGTQDQYNFVPSRNTVEHIYTQSKDQYIGLNENPEKIKGYPNTHIFWADEASELTEEAIIKAVPTVVRGSDNSICIWSYNPESEQDAIYKKFPFDLDELRKKKTLTIDKGVMVCWFEQSDNPFINQSTTAEMEMDYRTDPVLAASVWGGGFRAQSVGTLIPKESLKACINLDVGDVSSWSVHAGIDIGGTGDPTVCRIRQGRKFCKCKKWNEPDHVKLVPQVVEFLNENGVDLAICDGTGFGYTFSQFLAQQFGERRTMSVNFGGKPPIDGYNKNRSYMADHGLKTMIVSGCHVPNCTQNDLDFIEEMEKVKAWKNGGISYLDEKKNIKKYLGHSCDHLDAAMLTFAVGDTLKEHRNGNSANFVRLVMDAGAWNGRH